MTKKKLPIFFLKNLERKSPFFEKQLVFLFSLRYFPDFDFVFFEKHKMSIFDYLFLSFQTKKKFENRKISKHKSLKFFFYLFFLFAKKVKKILGHSHCKIFCEKIFFFILHFGIFQIREENFLLRNLTKKKKKKFFCCESFRSRKSLLKFVFLAIFQKKKTSFSFRLQKRQRTFMK